MHPQKEVKRWVFELRTVARGCGRKGTVATLEGQRSERCRDSGRWAATPRRRETGPLKHQQEMRPGTTEALTKKRPDTLQNVRHTRHRFNCLDPPPPPLSVCRFFRNQLKDMWCWGGEMSVHHGISMLLCISTPFTQVFMVCAEECRRGNTGRRP